MWIALIPIFTHPTLEGDGMIKRSPHLVAKLLVGLYLPVWFAIYKYQDIYILEKCTFA